MCKFGKHTLNHHCFNPCAVQCCNPLSCPFLTGGSGTVSTMSKIGTITLTGTSLGNTSSILIIQGTNRISSGFTQIVQPNGDLLLTFDAGVLTAAKTTISLGLLRAS